MRVRARVIARARVRSRPCACLVGLLAGLDPRLGLEPPRLVLESRFGLVSRSRLGLMSRLGLLGLVPPLTWLGLGLGVGLGLDSWGSCRPSLG